MEQVGRWELPGFFAERLASGQPLSKRAPGVGWEPQGGSRLLMWALVLARPAICGAWGSRMRSPGARPSCSLGALLRGWWPQAELDEFCTAWHSPGRMWVTSFQSRQFSGCSAVSPAPE